MNSKMEIRIREAAKRVGGLRSLSEKSGVGERTIANWLTGTEPRVHALYAVSVAAGVSIDWIVAGVEPATPVNSTFVEIPRYDARLAAGAGAFNERAQLLDHIPFTKEFIAKKLGRNTAEGLAILEARGDSMEPTIGDGDLVLVDRRQDALEDGIMAFVRDDTAYVKRIRCLLDGVEIISDNRDVYEPLVVSRERLGDLAIIGRVRWIGRVVGR